MAADAPRSLCSVGATLGEGPVWVARDAALWFVDIKESRLHRFHPETEVLTSWTAPAAPGWVLPSADGAMICGLKTGLHRFGPEGFSLLAEVEAHLPGNRLNDATVDHRGGLWFGSMDDAEDRPTGQVYHYADGDVRTVSLEPVTITNGPALSPDGRTLYHVDTLGGAIHAVTLESGRETVEARLFATIDPADGYPDGPTVDAEGCLWIGLFGGWGVRRYDPAGRLMEVVRFPVANVTKIAFGGDDLRTAFATTARKGLDAAALAAQPLAGDLFSFDPGVAGLPTHMIARGETVPL
ncbi:SMP-30/gluconolactonase/LRE family protein [Sphingomonas sp. AP4-R1]|uniref:SMP-30/gluconolactonase/LRE family protein n=1 Tax=Sphingomonas sp. AP4-R1 TaxID=2735134 RepID=UPI0014935A95|nr:SMP-30/gluconolactonase/LRE family protein [Sphingomonas sp. AP4-R1]QJU57699.1 SMP-30/gluconolactonase/LRE family protein [Sphingomonas sp. AP4-R1]